MCIAFQREFEEDVEATEFWNTHLTEFKSLSQWALSFLSIPGTSASSERIFSISGAVTKGNLSNTAPTLVEAKTLAKFNRKFLDWAL